jgi:hypothetical protein
MLLLTADVIIPAWTGVYTCDDGHDWVTNQAQEDNNEKAKDKVPFIGLSNAGLVEFNLLCEEIVEEHNPFPHFDEHYTEWATQFCNKQPNTPNANVLK